MNRYSSPESHAIRPEESMDHAAVDALYEVAFESRVEADLVALLRRDCSEHFALVALSRDLVVGHILFTPMLISESTESEVSLADGLGLGPMAVRPEFQNQGIGSRLAQAGLEMCERRGANFVAVLGHPEYYPRFGFERASLHGLRCEWDGVPDEAFLVKIFRPAALPAEGGVARYHEEFGRAI